MRKHYPHSLLHFEDFGVKNANRLLHKYRDTHAVFNDDMYATVSFLLLETDYFSHKTAREQGPLPSPA